LGIPNVEMGLLPTPVEALRGVRVGSIGAAGWRSYAVADTGELWAWGKSSNLFSPLGHGEEVPCLCPRPIASLRGMKVDAVTASDRHTLALADDGSVYAWGHVNSAAPGAFSLPGCSVCDAMVPVLTPQRIPGLRVACGP
jgi:alpha-tubulin suppressor-like RCC1 family protein